MRIIAVLVLAAVAGCSTPGEVVHSNSSSVAIRSQGSAEKDSLIAQQHCERFGKNARMSMKDGWLRSYDCVAP